MASKSDLLKTLLTNGTVTAPVLDEIAAAVGLGGEWDPSGTYKNSSRKWKRTLKRNQTMPGLYHATIPTTTGNRLHPFRLPSVKARELWSLDKEFFKMKESVPGRVETSGNWHNHPIFKEAGLQAVPLTFYGDAVPYITNKHGKKGSLMCLFYSFPHRLPALGADQHPGGDSNWMDDIHVFTVIRNEDICPKTFDAIWEVLTWDLTALQAGVFNKVRHDGKDFKQKEYLHAVHMQTVAGGARFALIQLKQDWEHLCNVYGFKNWGAHEFCPFCDARNEPASWIQGGLHAEWRGTIWDQAKLDQALHGLLMLPDGRPSTKMKWVSKLWGLPHFQIR